MRNRYNIALNHNRKEYSFPACALTQLECPFVKTCVKECENKVTINAKQQIIQDYIRTAAGRAALAQSMVQPLTLRRDTESIARKAFAVEPMPAGALPVYDTTADYSKMRID